MTAISRPDRPVSALVASLSVSDDSATNATVAVLTVVLVLNYMTTPLGWDQQINVAFAQQATLVGTFPENIVSAWTLRGVGYRFAVYPPFIVADAIVGYDNKPLFELVYRLQIAMVYLAVIGAAGLVARSRLRADGYDVSGILFAVTAVFFTVSHWVAFQPADIAALLTLMAVALSISELRGSTLLAGVVFALLGTLKGITVLVGLAGYLLVVSYEGEYREYYPWLVGSTLVSGLLMLGAMYVLAPRTVFDLLEGTQFQRTFGGSLPAHLRPLTTRLPLVHVPSLVPAGVAWLGLGAVSLRSQRYGRFAVLSGLVLVPTLYVVTQGKGFAYHFAAFLPSIVGVVVWTGQIAQERGSRRYSGALVLAILLVAAATVSPLSPFLSSPTEWRSDTQSQAETYSELREATGISASSTVLYLADGTATYYLQGESYLRYFYPLPLQRAAANPRLRDSEVFRQTYQRALDYTGRYVILTSWFDTDAFPRLEQKLDEEYCVVFEGSADAAFEGEVVAYERRAHGGGCPDSAALPGNETP